MHVKFFLLMLMVCLYSSALYAQNLGKDPKDKIYLDFGGSFGAFIPFNKTDGLKNKIGSNAQTTFQLTYKEHYFLKLILGQTTVNYKAVEHFDGLKTNTDAKVNSTNIGLGFGFQQRFHHWQPYVYMGAGIALIEKPSIDYDKSLEEVHFQTSSASQIFLTAGTGINYIISPTFILFGEIQVFTIPSLPENTLTHLNGLSPVIGIKSIL